jgi:hypothetical protein
MNAGSASASLSPAETPSDAVKVSLTWLRAEKGVPVCGGCCREGFRALYSLATSRADRVEYPDGTADIQVPPLHWLVQTAAMMCAGVAIAVLITVARQQTPSGFGIAALAGAVLGPLVFGRWIRRNPLTLLTVENDGRLLRADDGRVQIPVSDIDRLLLVAGRKLTALPEYPGWAAGSSDTQNAALLAFRKSDPEDTAILLFRHALPLAVMKKAASLAAETLTVPLEVLSY